jgi:hypothetical protein
MNQIGMPVGQPVKDPVVPPPVSLIPGLIGIPRNESINHVGWWIPALQDMTQDVHSMLPGHVPAQDTAGEIMHAEEAISTHALSLKDAVG